MRLYYRLPESGPLNTGRLVTNDGEEIEGVMVSTVSKSSSGPLTVIITLLVDEDEELTDAEAREAVRALEVYDRISQELS